MPRLWKALNAFAVLLPKIYLWWTLVSTGFQFLMETAGIVELVINCMALTFVLSVDEMVFERLATMAAKHMMTNLQDMPLFDTEREEKETEKEVLEQYEREEFGSQKWKIILMIVPR